MSAPTITAAQARQYLTLTTWASSTDNEDWLTSAARRAAEVTPDADPFAHLAAIEDAAATIGARVVHAETAVDAAELDDDRREAVAALLADTARHAASAHRTAKLAVRCLAGEGVR